MITRGNIVKNICVLSKTSGYSISKEANLVEVNGAMFYHFGTWKNDQLLNGIFLTERELDLIIKSFDKDIEIEIDENRKFERDLLQQAHNGGIDIEREK